MKTIGLLGGMNWESSIGYYRAINEGIKKSLGGLHSAKIAMYSLAIEILLGGRIFFSADSFLSVE